MHEGGVWTKGKIIPDITGIKNKLTDYSFIAEDFPQTSASILAIKKQILDDLA